MERSRIDNIQKSAFEANVKMPQTHLAIALFTLESSFCNSQGWPALLQVVRSVPEGEELGKRTEKANAQHRLYGIDRVLHEEDIRRLAISSVRSSLQIPYHAIPVSEHQNVESGEDSIAKEELPDWMTDEERHDLGVLAEALNTFDEYIFFSNLLKFSREFFSTDKVSSVLRKRKEIYSNWASLTTEEKDSIEQVNVEYTEQVRMLLKDAIDQYCQEQAATNQQKLLADRLLQVLEEIVDGTSGR
jgi:hypothetical protein